MSLANMQAVAQRILTQEIVDEKLGLSEFIDRTMDRRDQKDALNVENIKTEEDYESSLSALAFMSWLIQVKMSMSLKYINNEDILEASKHCAYLADRYKKLVEVKERKLKNGQMVNN